MTGQVKRLAGQAGFARVGVAQAAPLPAEKGFAEWVAAGFAGKMQYLKRHVGKRMHPERLVPGAKSVICLAVGYAPPAEIAAPAVRVARFARGRDYHKVLKRRCRRLMDAIRRIAPDFRGRAFVDAGPVGERSLAAAAGLGWIGRNGCLIVPGLGSYVVLAEIFCNLVLDADSPLEYGCAGCEACERACPTDAFVAAGLIDARKCISYLTIEHRGRIPPELTERMGGRIFGCDACQEPCPHNHDLPAGEAELTAAWWSRAGRAGPLGGAGLAEIRTWTEADWSAATEDSATRRASRAMLVRNATAASAFPV